MFFKKFKIDAVNRKTRKEYVFTLYSSNIDSAKNSISSIYLVQNIKELPTALSQVMDKLTYSKLNEDDVLKFLQFLAHALKRGVVLKKALQFLLSSEEKKAVRKLIQDIIDILDTQFSSYYDIFRQFPEQFPPDFLGIVRAGEISGSLAENILQYIEDSKKMKEQKAMMTALLAKRGILFGVVSLVGLVIVMVVIPQFTKLFKDTDPPPIFDFVLQISIFLQSYGLYLVGSVIAFVLFIISFYKTNYKFRKKLHKLIIKIPLYGDIFRTYFTAQFLYFTGSLLMKGVHFIRIMDILIDQTWHIPFQKVFKTIRENVIKGVGLPAMVKSSEQNLDAPYKKIERGYLLPNLGQALEMGSATGNMGEILFDSYAAYDVLLHQKIQRGIKVFDALFYSGIILCMLVLFAAMGSAMMGLYAGLET
ncbi:hypothetical protein COB57_01405 [Candidatus Peregrinibacteria bacterium]|nr:MAG: hypothetical protein COB57_01405 [Candidatus Peregrinibacteria bacterium]